MKYELTLKRGSNIKATVYVNNIQEVENLLKVCVNISTFDAEILDELHYDLEFIEHALNDFKADTISSEFGYIKYYIREVIENE